MVRLEHPTIPGVAADVPASAVEGWVASGWLDRRPQASVVVNEETPAGDDGTNPEE